ncbi:MAG: DUF1330 domain-containing protein [Holophagaceae bacterium]|nr:DUF1330 domain-containing protein [Holophagaceae bacterium]
MSVYIINNMTIRDREAYDRYVRAFWPLFLQHGGEVLAVQDGPEPLEGAWPFSRTVILRMPSREALDAWYHSPEYQAIAEIRKGAVESNIVVLPEFVAPARH